MAGALTPKQQWALRKEYGSLENARDEALDRSAELRDLWNAWSPPTPDFWKVFWEIALPVLGIEAGPSEAEAVTTSEPRGVKVELDLGGRGYTPVELAAGAKAYADGRRTIDEVKHAARISYRRARRLWSWLKAGAIFWNGRTVETAPGYRLIKVDADSDRSLIRLVRLYPA